MQTKNSRIITKSLALLLTLTLLFTSAMTAFAAAGPTEVKLVNYTNDMSLGDTYTFTAETGSTSPITWVVEQTGSVVTYNAVGTSLFVTAKTTGTFKVKAQITISSGVVEDSATVSIAADSFAISDSTDKINVGSTYTFKVKGTPADIANPRWNFNSNPSDAVSAVVNADKSYTVKGVKAGKTRIYAYSANGSIYDYKDVTIVDTAPTDTKLVFDNAKNTMSVNETYTFTAYKYPSGSAAGITFEAYAIPSSAMKIVYNSAGQIRITATGEGKIALTAKADGIPNIIQMVDISTAKTAVTGISMPAAVSMAIDETYTFKPTISPSSATNRAVSYRSSDTRIATIDSNGNLRPLSAGNTTITATTSDGNFSASTKVYVSDDSVVVEETTADDLLRELRSTASTRLSGVNVSFSSRISGTSLVAKSLKVSSTKLNQLTVATSTLNSLRDAGLSTILYELPWINVYMYPKMANGGRTTTTVGAQKVALTGTMRTKWNSLKLRAQVDPWKITGDNYNGLSLRILLPKKLSQTQLRLVRWNGTTWSGVSTSGWTVIKSGSNYYVRTGLIYPGTYAVVNR